MVVHSFSITYLIDSAPAISVILQMFNNWPPANRAFPPSPFRSHIRKALPIRQHRTQVDAPQFRYIATNWTNWEPASGRRNRQHSGRSDPAVMDAGRWPTYGHPRGTAGCPIPILWEQTNGRKPDSPPARRPVRGRTRRLLPDVRGWRPGAKPVTTVTAGRDAGREFRRDCRQRDGAGGDARADDRPRARVLPRLRRGTDGAPGRDGALRHDHRVDLRQARSGHLAAAAALDALQRGLERGLGAVAQRFGRRAPAGLDQRHGRQPVPAVVLHVRPGVQPRPRRATPTSAPTRS